MNHQADKGGEDRIAIVRAKVTQRYARVLEDDTLARHLELVTWNWAIRSCERDGIPLYWDEARFRYRYTTRALSLEFNLKKNDELRARVQSRALGVKKFVSLTPQEMCPDMWEETYQKAAIRQLRREAPTSVQDAPDGAYTCSRCKSQKTVYTAVQIRSADEPMTIFVTCLACGKNWKD